MPLVPLLVVGGLLVGGVRLPAQEPEVVDDPEAASVVLVEDAGIDVLDAVVVTATRSESRVFDVPYTAASVDAERIQQRLAARTLPDALREVPGVMVQKTSTGQGSPYIRGFTGFRTLLLIDGIRLNNAVFRDGPNQYWSTVDPLTIDRLEVVKGPSSVLYGSDAIGGTVNAITRSRDPAAAGLPTPWSGTEWERRVYYRYASAENANVVRGEVSGSYGRRLGLIGGVSYKDVGDISAGRDLGLLPYTAYDELDGDFKASYLLAPELELIAAYQHAGLDGVPRTHSTLFSRPWEGTTPGTDQQREYDQQRDLAYGQVHWKNVASWLSRLSASLSYQLQQEEEDRVRGDGRRTVQGFDDGTLGAWVQLESISSLGTLTYGLEYYHDDVSSFARRYNADGTPDGGTTRGPVADDATYDQLGVYVEDRFDPTDWLELSLGVRLNYIHAAADQVDPNPGSPPDFGSFSDDYTAAVGSARALFLPLEEWNLFAGASQGFRAPNLSDLTRFDASRSGEVEIPAPDLGPEHFLTLEVGTHFLERGSGIQAFASYYYTFIDDMIVRFPTGATVDGDPVVTKDNVGDGYVQGVELGVSWRFYEGFTAFGTFSWTDGKADNYTSPGVQVYAPLSRLQPITGLVGLRWESRHRLYWVEGTALLVNAQGRLSPADERDTQRIPPGGTPGYAVFSLRGGVTPLHGLRLFAAVENLTNEDYRVHGSGQNEPGTNFIVGTDWRF